jgi:hypothetical protein
MSRRYPTGVLGLSDLAWGCLVSPGADRRRDVFSHATLPPSRVGRAFSPRVDVERTIFRSLRLASAIALAKALRLMRLLPCSTTGGSGLREV